MNWTELPEHYMNAMFDMGKQDLFGNKFFFLINHIVGKGIRQAFGHKMTFLRCGNKVDTVQVKYQVQQLFLFNLIRQMKTVS